MNWLNYHHLLNFWMVAREGSVQRASEMLHVTPATISIQIRQLERSLGVRLFVKSGRGLALTEMGEQVAEYASEIFTTGQELLELVKGRPTGRATELRIGVRDVMPKQVAYQLMQPALKMDGDLRVLCVEGDMARLVADLAVHKLDLVLSDTALDPLFKVQAYSHLLGESEVVVVGNPALAKQYRKGFPSSLEGAPFLLPTDTSILRRSLDQWFYELQIKPIVRGEFADSAMLQIAGSEGMGLFAVPQIVLEDVERMHRVEAIGVIPKLREQFFAVSVERKAKHPAVAAISRAARVSSTK